MITNIYFNKKNMLNEDEDQQFTNNDMWLSFYIVTYLVALFCLGCSDIASGSLLPRL